MLLFGVGQNLRPSLCKFSQTVKTPVLSRGLSPPLRILNASVICISFYLVANLFFFPVFYPSSFALMMFSFEFSPSIRNSCRYYADTFLFLTRVSLIILHMPRMLRGSYSYEQNYHLVVQPARISLILSHHSSLSFIASGRSSGLHPVLTELLFVGSNWSPCFCSAIWAGHIV